MALFKVKQFLGGWLLVVMLVSAASVYALSFGKYEKVKASNGVVTLSAVKLTDGKAHFYKFEDAGKEIAFMLVKAPDGTYKAAFDACDSCFKEKKGYEQQDDKLICKNCNKKFAINKLGPNATGGCNPGYLPHQMSGATITIKADDLKGGAKYF